MQTWVPYKMDSAFIISPGLVNLLNAVVFMGHSRDGGARCRDVLAEHMVGGCGKRLCESRRCKVRLGSSNRQWRNDLPVSALGWAPTALDTGRFWWLSRWWFPTVELEIGPNNLNLTPLDDNLPGKPAGGDGTTAPSFTLTSLRASPSTFSSLHRGILRGPSAALKIFPQT